MVQLPRIRIPPPRGWPRLHLLSSVRGQLIAGFALLVLILIVVVAGSAWLHRQHQRALVEMEEHAATASLLEDARLNGNTAALLLQRYVAAGEDTLVPEIRSSVAATVDNLKEAIAQEEQRPHAEQLARLREMTAAAADLPEAAEQIIALRQSGDVPEAVALVDAMALQFRQFRLELASTTEFERQEVAALRSRADRAGDLTFWLLVMSGVIGAAVGLAASALIARSILKPLSAVESAALAVAGGDLKARAQATGPRELARLGASLNRMTESLLDATRRRELEEELSKLSCAVQQSPSTVIITDTDGNIEYVNPKFTQITGYTLEDVIGKNPRILKSGETSPEEYKRLWETITSGGEWRGVFHNKRKNGELYWESASISSIKDPDGTITHFLAVKEDVTERMRAEEALRESEEKFRIAFDHAPIGVGLADPTGKLLKVNPAFCELLGRSEEKMLATDFQSLTHPDDLEADLVALREMLASQMSIFRREKRFIHADGQAVWTLLTAALIRDSNGQPLHFIGQILDINERKQAEEALGRLNEQLEKEHQETEQLNRSLEKKVRQRTQALRQANKELSRRNRQLLDARAQAATDGLTGLSNHRSFHERIREEVHRAQETNSPVGLIMLDIDGFKRVNDALGHLAGDEILRELARTLTDVARQEDTYRYGGDEFAVLLPDVEPRKTTRLAERLRRAVEGRTDGGGEKITVSLGVASFPDIASSAEELIYGADAAMYWAKSAGKNRVGDWSKLINGRTKGTLPWYAADRNVRAPDAVAALVAALAAKDPVTAAHTERCSWYAATLAEELGLPEDETSVVRLASLLHDIGKLAVPDDVLFKPGPLNDEEWSIIKQHPAMALHVLGHIRSITDATPAILHHHEHFDGSGYPDGLAGESIPVASRILLVTDAFDAMTTDRPYRKAMPVETAIDELKRYAGSQFDPTVVEAFLKILSHHGPQPLRSQAACHAEPNEPSKPARRRNVAAEL